jgi:hypothetical protein
MYGRRRQLSAEETEFNAQAKIRREAASMTCQCCWRKFLANTGKMAHHGYQRPGDGWQTASCYGARHLPFEADRDTLGDMILALKRQYLRLQAYRRDTVAEKHPLEVTYSDLSVPRDRRGQDPVVVITVCFTRKTFKGTMAIHKEGLTRHGRNIGTYDDVKATDLKTQADRITRIKHDIVECQKRHNAWKRTHHWDHISHVWRKEKK